mmetsp:Transcript_64418/g.162130  ORF Transcript_64418/g.162130 Transcript_64418/m.162130 type:complete len:203 (-) Transcript_64418:753-1361(-)
MVQATCRQQQQKQQQQQQQRRLQAIQWTLQQHLGARQCSGRRPIREKICKRQYQGLPQILFQQSLRRRGACAGAGLLVHPWHRSPLPLLQQLDAEEGLCLNTQGEGELAIVLEEQVDVPWRRGRPPAGQAGGKVAGLGSSRQRWRPRGGDLPRPHPCSRHRHPALRAQTSGVRQRADCGPGVVARLSVVGVQRQRPRANAQN